MGKIMVVGLGALNMDYIYRTERFAGDAETVAPALAPGIQDIKSEFIGAFPGGSAANTIYALAKLGEKTGFVGVVGDDTDGRALIRDFQKAGVDASQIKMKPEAQTGTALCLIDRRNSRSIRIIPGANDLLTMDDLDSNYINRAEILHISSFAGERQFELLLELMNTLDSSVKVSFSPGALYAAREIESLAPIIKRSYVLFINESEIRQLTGARNLEAGAETLLKLGCQIAVVTLGRGIKLKTVIATSYIRTAEGESIVEPGNEKATGLLDTIGAGDAFAAGFLYGLLKDKPLGECGRLGDIVARFSIQKIGARDGLPTLRQLTPGVIGMQNGSQPKNP